MAGKIGGNRKKQLQLGKLDRIRKKEKQDRVYADYSTGLNNCLKQINYPLPLAERIFAQLNKAWKFSKLDLLEVYMQIPDIGIMVRVFANGPGDLGSILGRVIPKTQKMVLDATLLNTQHYKVRIKGKVEQSREKSSALPYTLVQQLLKREPSGHPRLWSPTLLFYLHANTGR